MAGTAGQKCIEHVKRNHFPDSQRLICPSTDLLFFIALITYTPVL